LFGHRASAPHGFRTIIISTGMLGKVVHDGAARVRLASRFDGRVGSLAERIHAINLQRAEIVSATRDQRYLSGGLAAWRNQTLATQ
jgi:hypothetical protein